MEHKQEMHDVVEMLLNRMKNYPEDFIGSPNDYRDMVENKWKRALRLISGVVAPHEKEALDIRLEEARRAVYMGAALKEILGPDEPMQEVGDGVKLKSASHVGFGQAPIKAEGGMIGYNTTSNSIHIGKAQLTEDKVNMIDLLEARQKFLEEQMKRQYVKKLESASHVGFGQAPLKAET